jgi:RNA polymerase sigma factor (TIGR02999 family)
MASSAEITRMLRAWSGGDRTALNDLMPIVYDQLCSIAAKYFRSERSSILQTAAVVHEAFLRLAGSEVEWNDRVHFFAVAARTMRRILVDHARARQRVRRGGGEVAFSLDEALTVSKEPDKHVVELDTALVSLAEFDPRKSEILEMFYFGGMTYEEIAGATGISEATVHRELKLAKAWLRQELSAMPEVSVCEVHPGL